MQFIYQIIYSPSVNYCIRNVVKALGLPKKFQIPPSGEMKHEVGKGAFIRLATNPTCHVTSELFWQGSYEYDEVFKVLIGQAKCFFDVGSNIGYFSMLAAKVNPNIKVYAFDPSPGPFHYLCENIKLNGFEKNIVPNQLALSDKVGSIEFILAYNPKYTFLKYNTLGGAGHISGVRPDSSSKKVVAQTNTLDNYVAQNGIEQIDFIKLDAEEAEHMILNGGQETIKRFRPIIACEVFDNSMASTLDQALISIGYTPYLSFYNGKEQYFLKISEIHTLISEINRNFFFVPAEKESQMTPFLKQS